MHHTATEAESEDVQLLICSITELLASKPWLLGCVLKIKRCYAINSNIKFLILLKRLKFGVQTGAERGGDGQNMCILYFQKTFHVQLVAECTFL